jgi:hypothetical protein
MYDSNTVEPMVPKLYTADWIKYIIAVFVTVVPVLITLIAPSHRWVVAFMAYINCLLYSAFAVYFLKKGTLGCLIPVMAPLWLIIGTCGGIIYFAMFHPEAGYWTPGGYVSYFAGGVKYQLAIGGFLLVYLASMVRLLRGEDEVAQHPAMISSRVGYMAAAIIVFSASVEIIMWFMRTVVGTPLFLFLWVGRLFVRYKTLLFVPGAAIVRISRSGKIFLVFFLVAITFFYTLRNARAMALIPIAALFCGLLFFSESKTRTKLTVMAILIVGIPIYLMVGNTARILLGSAAGREASFEQQLSALKDWRVAAEQSETGLGFFGRMFFTSGNVIVAHTPSQYPYRYPSPVKYAKELAIYMLPDPLIRKLVGVEDRLTKLSLLFRTDYTGTGLLRDFGMEVSPTTSVEVSTIGHFWMLGGFLPVLLGGFAVALVHALVARITRRLWIKNPDKAVFYFACVFFCFIWSMNWDFIQLLRNLLWNSIYAFVGWMLISPFLKIGSGAMSVQYEQLELMENAE